MTITAKQETICQESNAGHTTDQPAAYKLSLQYASVTLDTHLQNQVGKLFTHMCLCSPSITLFTTPQIDLQHTLQAIFTVRECHIGHTNATSTESSCSHTCASVHQASLCSPHHRSTCSIHYKLSLQYASVTLDTLTQHLQNQVVHTHVPLFTKLGAKESLHATHRPRVRGLAASAGVWLTAMKTEISAALLALVAWEGL